MLIATEFVSMTFETEPGKLLVGLIPVMICPLLLLLPLLLLKNGFLVLASSPRMGFRCFDTKLLTSPGPSGKLFAMPVVLENVWLVGRGL